MDVPHYDNLGPAFDGDCIRHLANWFLCNPLYSRIGRAGFVPGILLYFTYWFPAATRTRITALFIMGIPLSNAIGSPISSYLLGIDAFGLHAAYRVQQKTTQRHPIEIKSAVRLFARAGTAILLCDISKIVRQNVSVLFEQLGMGTGSHKIYQVSR